MKLKKIAALFAAVVFAFAVVACDDGDDATPSPEPVATTEPVDETTDETTDEGTEETTDEGTEETTDE